MAVGRGALKPAWLGKWREHLFKEGSGSCSRQDSERSEPSVVSDAGPSGLGSGAASTGGPLGPCPDPARHRGGPTRGFFGDGLAGAQTFPTPRGSVCPASQVTLDRRSPWGTEEAIPEVVGTSSSSGGSAQRAPLGALGDGLAGVHTFPMPRGSIYPTSQTTLDRRSLWSTQEAIPEAVAASSFSQDPPAHGGQMRSFVDCLGPSAGAPSRAPSRGSVCPTLDRSLWSTEEAIPEVMPPSLSPEWTGQLTGSDDGSIGAQIFPMPRGSICPASQVTLDQRSPWSTEEAIPEAVASSPDWGQGGQLRSFGEGLLLAAGAPAFPTPRGSVCPASQVTLDRRSPWGTEEAIPEAVTSSHSGDLDLMSYSTGREKPGELDTTQSGNEQDVGSLLEKACAATTEVVTEPEKERDPGDDQPAASAPGPARSSWHPQGLKALGKALQGPPQAAAAAGDFASSSLLPGLVQHRRPAPAGKYVAPSVMDHILLAGLEWDSTRKSKAVRKSKSAGKCLPPTFPGCDEDRYQRHSHSARRKRH